MKTRLHGWALGVGALAFAGVMGCNGGGGVILSGLPQDTPVNELSDDDVDQLCTSIDAYLFRIYPVSEEHRVSCTGTALSRTATEAACDGDVDTCMDMAFEGRDHLDCERATTAGCTASVNQIETCIEDRARSIEERAADVQCSAAGDLEEIGRLIAPIPLPPTCTSLSSVCRAEIGI